MKLLRQPASIILLTCLVLQVFLGHRAYLVFLDSRVIKVSRELAVTQAYPEFLGGEAPVAYPVSLENQVGQVIQVLQVLPHQVQASSSPGNVSGALMDMC